MGFLLLADYRARFAAYCAAQLLQHRKITVFAGCDICQEMTEKNVTS
jgi:hypothetical protein